MDAVFAMAENVVSTRFDDLPAEVIQATKNDILDTLGTALAGSAAVGCREVVDTLLATCAGGLASVWGYGRKLPAPDAALANGTMAHALDLDDTHDGAVLHAGVSVVPAVLAVCEQVGGVSGKDLITATTLGIDWLCRMGLATTISPISSGWMYTSTYGFFGATASGCRLLGLGAEQTVNAMGIAYAQAAGNTQCMPDGALTKRMQPGFAARAGVLSALLARSGITGASNVLDGTAGFYRVYLKGAYDRERLLRGLGKEFEGVALSFKPYPSCRHTHTAIDATLQILKERRIDPEGIEEIRVGVNQQAYQNVCTPAAVKCAPRTIVDAQFSIPYCIAAAICRQEVFIESFSIQAIESSEIVHLAQKVKPRIDNELERSYSRQITPAIVEVVMRDGTVHCATKIIPWGSPEEPMGFDALAAKFRRCAGYAREPLPDQQVSAVIDIIANLDALTDARELVRMLA